MANPKIILKKSSIASRVPAADDLVYGELALNYNDGIIYYKTASNIVNKFVSGDHYEDNDVITLVDSDYVNARVDVDQLEIVRDIDNIDSDLTTTSSDQIIDSWDKDTYRSAKYIVQLTAHSKYHSTEILLLHDDTNVYITQYASLTSDSDLGTIDASLTSGNVNLTLTPSYANTSIVLRRTRVDR